LRVGMAPSRLGYPPCEGPTDWECVTATKTAVPMAEVLISENESFERALRRFEKKCERAGILSDLRRHRHYEKPSERRKRGVNAARRTFHRPHG
jgi:small subunit ribosomal protein S21